MPARDPATALVSVLAEAVAPERPEGYMLFAGDDADLAARTVGGRRVVWVRRAGGPTEPQCWPTGGPFAGAALRLPRSREEIEMTIHALASVMPPGSPLFVYGPNAEGIRSAPEKLSPLFEDAEMVLAKRHARIVRARRSTQGDGLKTPLTAWRRLGEIGAARTPWVSYPGVFAEGRVDLGTSLLVQSLPELARHHRVLDYGCGTGPLARAVLEESPNATIDMLDADIIALEAARENVPKARPLLGVGLQSCGTQRYDLIVSNPPIHKGSELDFSVVSHLIADAPAHLSPGGSVWLVTQQTVPVPRFAEGVFGDVRLVAEEEGYRIWCLSGALGA